MSEEAQATEMREEPHETEVRGEPQTTEMREEPQETEMSDEVKEIVREHALWSMLVGFIPIPVLDVAVIAGFQLNMLRRLAKVYKVPFDKEKVKHVVGSLIGGGIAVPISTAIGSLVKVVPVVGHTVSHFALPISSASITYAVGRVFVQHFASGGTFLTFDPEKVRDYYAEKLQEGEAVASSLKA